MCASFCQQRYKHLKNFLHFCSAKIVIPLLIIAFCFSASQALAINASKFLQDVIEKIKKNYVEEVDEEKLIDGALEGMLPSLDPHSVYLNPANFHHSNEVMRGELGGIGVELMADHNLLRVVSPYENGPAFEAGIRTNDVITSVNGKNIADIAGGIPSAIDELRGAPGSVVKMEVIKEDGRVVEYQITRKVIKMQSVSVKLLANQSIAYIKIERFDSKTADSVQKEFGNLRKMAGKPLDGIILDLRWNPGGLLMQAVDVVDLFLSDRDIVSVRGRDKDSHITYHANEGDISDGIPIVVITNAGTASAGEIVAGALQDNKRALILGVKTFGKGSVQKSIPLPNGGALRLTTDLYYTPSGRTIQAIGIIPDIVVEEAVVNPVRSKDKIVSEASLKGHIIAKVHSSNAKDVKNNNLVHKESYGNKVDQNAQNTVRIQKKNPQRGGNINTAGFIETVIGDETHDFQLMRAIDIIKGMVLLKVTGEGLGADVSRETNREDNSKVTYASHGDSEDDKDQGDGEDE